MVAAAFLFRLCWAEEWGYFLHLLGEVECFYSKETRCDERMERRAQSELCLALNLFPVGWAWRREPVDNPDPWGRWGGAKAVVQLFFKPSLWCSSCRGSQLPQALGSATGKRDFFPDFQSEFPVLLLVPVPLAFSCALLGRVEVCPLCHPLKWVDSRETISSLTLLLFSPFP